MRANADDDNPDNNYYLDSLTAAPELSTILSVSKKYINTMDNAEFTFAVTL